MATLEDKILGDKRENYCSSSEDEHEDSDNDENEEVKYKQAEAKEEASAETQINEWNGTSSNTGPKGVLNDWEQYKKHQIQLQQEKNIERIQQIKKMTITCQSQEQPDDDIELLMLEDDGFLLEYQKQKMKEMMNKNGQQNKTFGNLITIQNSDQFLNEIDNENKNVTIVVHLSDDNKQACRSMNENLFELSKMYNVNYKFCTLPISNIDSNMLSNKFKSYAVPALLIYKNEIVIGNFINIVDELGELFYLEDLESFLIDHGILFDRQCVPGILRSSLVHTNCDDSD